MARASVHRHVALPLLALSSLVLVCEAAAEGCSLEGNLVCGDDGITYQNACLAQGQGVKVVQDKPCSDRTKSADPANIVATANLDTSGSASLDDLFRFQDEGFKLVAKVHLVDTPPPHPRVAPGSTRTPKNSGPVFATRITPLGLLYIQAIENTVAPGAGEQIESPHFIPTDNSTIPASRKLLIWGTDDRVRQDFMGQPWIIVGQLVGQKANGDDYTCSGALVGPSTIFTAGHCVYDAFAGAFSKSLSFIAASIIRYDNLGMYPWVTATTYWSNARGHCNADGSCDLGVFKYDLAVIRIGQPVGEAVGWFGMKWEAARRSYSVTSAGYPLDKYYERIGYTMWKTSGTLEAFAGADFGIKDGKNAVVRSDLDVAPGQFGSNAWDDDFNTRALVIAEGSDGRAYQRTVTRSVVKFVLDNSKGLNLFSKRHYGGDPWDGDSITLLPGNHPRMPAAKYDNWASSATISPGCTATLYENTNYRGRKLVVKAKMPSFGTFDNKASSVKLVCKKN